TNLPPALTWGVATWTDLQGNLWLFGGEGLGDFADLWKYEISTNTWTWMKGPGTPNSPGSYGTQTVPALSNNPRSRMEIASSWTDSNGDLWCFGGSTTGGYLNDLWRFNIGSNTWTWMKGSSTTNQ